MSNRGLLRASSPPAPATLVPGFGLEQWWPPTTFAADQYNYGQPDTRCSYLPFVWPVNVELIGVTVWLETVGTAGAGVATSVTGIYEHSPENGPGRLLAQIGTLDLTATTGARSIGCSIPVPARQIVWVAQCHGLAGTRPSMICCMSGYEQQTTLLGFTSPPFSNSRYKQIGWSNTIPDPGVSLPGSVSPRGLSPAVVSLTGEAPATIWVKAVAK